MKIRLDGMGGGMCRLLGMIANKSVDLEFSLERFKEHSADNPDGWGIGWYENNSPKVFKQGIPAKAKDSKLHTLSKEVLSKIIIAHVRKRTGTEPSERNSHPFKYKNWLFAHNGSVDRGYFFSLLRSEYKNELKGETDSEVYFYWILQNIENYGDALTGIKEAIKKIIQRDYSGLNFLLSNGKSLYAFRYSSRSHSYYSLYKLKRDHSERGPLELKSEKTKALLRSKSLKGEKAILVCSEELTREEGGSWEEVKLGNILIITSDLSMKEEHIV